MGAETVDSVDDERAMTANLRLIPIHEGLASAYFWIPVLVLFTRSRFGLDGALLLAALYYLFVVIIEVPSGWMSDRLGRVVTLRLAAVSWIVAQTCFLVGDDRLVVIAAGQFFMAAGFASLSGTDVTFHYDTLEQLGRADAYAGRQARVKSLGYGVSAASAITGGLLALIDLRLAFAAALTAAVVQLGVTLRLTEPTGRPRSDRAPAVPVAALPATERAGSLRSQLAACGRYLTNRFVGWIFFYGIVLVTLEHVAFTVLQPWLTELLDNPATDLGSTPALSGFVTAGFSLVGSGAARLSAPLAARFGSVRTLIGLAALSALIVTGMALWIHAAVLVLIAFRSAQGAAAPVLISAEVAPRVSQHHRATLLSLNSLAGRLGYGLLLLVVSRLYGDEVLPVLGLFSWLSWGLVAVLVVTAAVVLRSADSQRTAVRVR